MGRSEEKSILLDVPRKLYGYKRIGKLAAATAIQAEKNPIVAGQLIYFLMLDPRHASLSARDLRPVLSTFANNSTDEDLARLCTFLMLAGLKLVPHHPQPSGSLILRHLGYAIPPAKVSFLAGFFKDLYGIPTALAWDRLLGKKAHSELQRRAIALRGGWAGNPSLLITLLDSFNDLLIQRFSREHKALKKAFRKAAGKKAKIPDFGSWLQDGSLTSALPKACPIFLECHRLRVRTEIAHASDKKTGRFTRPVSYYEKARITKKLKTAYVELLAEWTKI
jgi:hypothetical protein